MRTLKVLHNYRSLKFSTQSQNYQVSAFTVAPTWPQRKKILWHQPYSECNIFLCVVGFLIFGRSLALKFTMLRTSQVKRMNSRIFNKNYGANLLKTLSNEKDGKAEFYLEQKIAIGLQNKRDLEWMLLEWAIQVWWSLPSRTGQCKRTGFQAICLAIHAVIWCAKHGGCSVTWNTESARSATVIWELTNQTWHWKIGRCRSQLSFGDQVARKERESGRGRR